MSDRQKSAKDIAWDKERAKYQKQIRDLRDMVEVWQEEFRNASTICNELLEENTKLKELLNLNEEELRLLIDKERRAEKIHALFSVMGKLGGGY